MRVADGRFLYGGRPTVGPIRKPMLAVGNVDPIMALHWTRKHACVRVDPILFPRLGGKIYLEKDDTRCLEIFDRCGRLAN